MKVPFIYLLFASTLSIFAQLGDAPAIEKSLNGRNDIIFFGGFEEGFSDSAWEDSWGIQWLGGQSRTEIIEDGCRAGKILRVNYPEGGLGPQETGAQFPIVFRDMEGNTGGLYQEAYLRYHVKFEEGFDFNKGGKLPGFMGGENSWVRSGGNQPDGNNGWTLRFMWRKDGELVIYAYVPKSQNGKWGSQTWGQDISTHVEAQPGEWHCIEQYVHVGNPGKDDGVLKVWIDGDKKINIHDIRFWDVENDAGLIGGIYFSTFHGGNSRDWSPRNDSYARFDGFVVAKQKVGCKNP